MYQSVNQSIKIIWKEGRPDLVTLNLQIDGKCIKYNTLLQKLIITELEELLHTLFHEAQTLIVESMPYGYSGTRVLKVQPFFLNQSGGRKVVVKFGDFHQIEQEYSNFMKYVQYFIGDGRNTAFLAYARTQHLGGIVCSLLGTSIDTVQSFSVFYSQNDACLVKDALDKLFYHTCGPWYIGHRSLWPLNLTEDYQRHFGYTLEQIERIISKDLMVVQRKGKLIFRNMQSKSEHSFANPLYVLMRTQPLICSTYVCITHGDFNQHNLFVDSSRNAWLIDFQSTGPGHILRDIAMLDSAIRFQLLLPDEATLDERIAMEEALCSIKQFSQLEQLKAKFSTKNTALAKAYETVVHLRILARWMVEKNLTDDISEYYIALLYCALNTLQFSSLDEEQHKHALLSACLLTNCIR